MCKVVINVFCHFSLFLQFFGIIFGNWNSDNLKNESSSVAETAKQSFTERLLMQHAGIRIDLRKLLQEYALICPLDDSCGIDIDQKLLHVYDGYNNTINPECRFCTCGSSCLRHNYCCPASHFGYIDFECINTTLFYTGYFNGQYGRSYLMITKCLHEYQENTSVVEQCTSTISPCTSVASGLTYKNNYCALCNEEIECVPWSIETECNLQKQEFQKILSSISSLSEMNNVLREYECEIYLKPPLTAKDISWQNFRCYRNYENKTKINTHVDRCNFTGLWDKYDVDVEWACENFIAFPYKEFKNVFCYICNPSIANIQNVSIIDSCRGSTNLTENIVLEACESLPTSARLKPFKNIFCFACNQDPYLLHNTSDYAFGSVSEKNSLLKYGTELSFYFSVLGQNKTLSMQRFLKNTFNEMFQNVDIRGTLYKNSEMFDDVLKLNKIKEDYISVCGTKTLCNASTYQKYKTYGSPVCGHGCFCDGLCAEYENCCPDLLFQEQPYSCFDPTGLPSLEKVSHFKSGVRHDEPLPSYFPESRFKVIDKCLVKNKDAVVEEKCSSPGDQTDILTSIPVTLLSGISYRNVYCYVCNNNKSDIFVGFQVLCNAYIEHKLFTSLFQLLGAVNSFCNKVFFVPLKGRHCKGMYDSLKAGFIGGEKYVRSTAYFVHPLQPQFSQIWGVHVKYEDLNDIVRSVFSRCNQTGNLKEEEKLLSKVCESEDENILALREYRIENSVYKNFACFVCNPNVTVTEDDFSNITSNCLVNASYEWYEHYKDLEELCNVTEFHPRWFPFKNMYCSECNLPSWQLVYVRVSSWGVKDKFGVSRYTHLFPLSRGDFERLVLNPTQAETPQCSTGTFDHSLKQCRLLYCNGGFELFNDTCIPVLRSASNLEYQVDFKLRYLSGEPENNSTKIERNTPIIIDLDVLCSRVLEIITEEFPDTTSYLADKDCYPSNYVGFVSVAETDTETDQALSLNETYVNFDIARTTQSQITPQSQSYYDIESIGQIHVHILINIMYAEKIALIQRSLVKAQDKTYRIHNISDMQGIAWSIDFISQITTEKLNVLSNTGLDGQQRAVSDRIIVDKFYICPHVKFNFSDAYFNMENSELLVKERNLTFTFDEYTISERYVAICLEDFNRKMKLAISIQAHTCNKTSNLDSIFSGFDLMCSLLSMGCLLLTIITYCLFSSLRTISGLNIMTLCIFLFCSQGFFQFGLDVSKGTTLCKIVGVCIHLFWLASFFSMNICSFHTFRVFVYKNTLNRQSGRFLFIKYLIYIISLPIVCVLISVSVNMTKYFNLGYGDNLCFLSDFYVFVGTFLIPSCVIFVSNIVFFATAFHKIRTAGRVQSTHERNNFYICLKLCAIVGVTWPLLILDSIVQLTWFSFIVSGVNSLQGVFIFMSFVFNKRVKSLYSTLFRKKPTNLAGKTSTDIANRTGK